ncbi:hypothetical protein CY35_16G041300 [Sphagnum magellanicum]|nr:hypothetical protein CY35_16G041300 [Sphagnum magellanicum]
MCSSSVQILYTGVVFSIFLTEQHSEAFQVSAELAHGFHPSSKDKHDENDQAKFLKGLVM